MPRRKDIIRSRICKNDAFGFDGGSSASSGLSGLCIISLLLLLLLLVCVELLLYFLHVWVPILKTFYVVPVPYHSIDARDLPVATVDLEN